MPQEIDLEQSTKIVGQLYPVLLAKDGTIIDGNHRGKNWKRIKLDQIDTVVETRKLLAKETAK